MIKIKEVSKIYNNQFDALKNINLHVHEKDIFGIVGKSGAGKSTMLKIVGLLEKPTSGVIEVMGKDLSKINSKEELEIKRSMGTVFQGFNLLMQRNVEQNIAFPLELVKTDKAYTKQRCQELAELVGLGDKLNSYPVQLSGGQKQRVAIARALATNPKVLLCDEPTSALDGFTTKEILKLLKDINQKLGITIVIITHELSVVRAICNKTVVLNDGEVIEQGETKAVFENPQNDITKQIVNYFSEDDF